MAGSAATKGTKQHVYVKWNKKPLKDKPAGATGGAGGRRRGPGEGGAEGGGAAGGGYHSPGNVSHQGPVYQAAGHQYIDRSVNISLFGRSKREVNIGSKNEGKNAGRVSVNRSNFDVSGPQQQASADITNQAAGGDIHANAMNAKTAMHHGTINGVPHTAATGSGPAPRSPVGGTVGVTVGGGGKKKGGKTGGGAPTSPTSPVAGGPGPTPGPTPAAPAVTPAAPAAGGATPGGGKKPHTFKPVGIGGGKPGGGGGKPPAAPAAATPGGGGGKPPGGGGAPPPGPRTKTKTGGGAAGGSTTPPAAPSSAGSTSGGGAGSSTGTAGAGTAGGGAAAGAGRHDKQRQQQDRLHKLRKVYEQSPHTGERDAAAGRMAAMGHPPEGWTPPAKSKPAAGAAAPSAPKGPSASATSAPAAGTPQAAATPAAGRNTSEGRRSQRYALGPGENKQPTPQETTQPSAAARPPLQPYEKPVSEKEVQPYSHMFRPEGGGQQAPAAAQASEGQTPAAGGKTSRFQQWQSKRQENKTARRTASNQRASARAGSAAQGLADLRAQREAREANQPTSWSAHQEAAPTQHIPAVLSGGGGRPALGAGRVGAKRAQAQAAAAGSSGTAPRSVGINRTRGAVGGGPRRLAIGAGTSPGEQSADQARRDKRNAQARARRAAAKKAAQESST